MNKKHGIAISMEGGSILDPEQGSRMHTIQFLPLRHAYQMLQLHRVYQKSLPLIEFYARNGKNVVQCAITVGIVPILFILHTLPDLLS